MTRRGFLCCAGCLGASGVLGCRSGAVGAKRGGTRPEAFAYCGVDCRACDVRKATVDGDREARQRAARDWAQTAREHWGMETLDPGVLDCAGCRVTEVQHKGHGRCPIRACVRERRLASCALCAEWRQCARLAGVLRDVPEARRNLESVG